MTTVLHAVAPRGDLTDLIWNLPDALFEPRGVGRLVSLIANHNLITELPKHMFTCRTLLALGVGDAAERHEGDQDECQDLGEARESHRCERRLGV